MLRDARHKMEIANEAMKSSVRRRATKELDRMWGKTAVCCPHCYGGLLSEGFARGTLASSLEVDRPWGGDNDDPPGLMGYLGMDRVMVMGFFIGGPLLWEPF